MGPLMPPTAPPAFPGSSVPPGPSSTPRSSPPYTLPTHLCLPALGLEIQQPHQPLVWCSTNPNTVMHLEKKEKSAVYADIKLPWCAGFPTVRGWLTHHSWTVSTCPEPGPLCLWVPRHARSSCPTVGFSEPTLTTCSHPLWSHRPLRLVPSSPRVV